MAPLNYDFVQFFFLLRFHFCEKKRWKIWDSKKSKFSGPSGILWSVEIFLLILKVQESKPCGKIMCSVHAPFLQLQLM